MSCAAFATTRPVTEQTGPPIGSTKEDCDHALASNEGPSRLGGDAGLGPCGRGAVCDRVHTVLEQCATGAAWSRAAPAECAVRPADHEPGPANPEPAADVPEHAAEHGFVAVTDLGTSAGRHRSARALEPARTVA